MFGHIYYHGSIKKYVALFGTIFNDITINREDEDGEIVQSLKVPIMYAPRDKMLARIREHPDLTKPAATVLPRMSFSIEDIMYDSIRKLATTRKIVKKASANNAPSTQYNPVAYLITFDLNIFTHTIEDGTKIVEQILPFFTPDWTVSALLVPETDITVDVPIVLKSVKHEDAYEGDYTARRTIVWTLTFDMSVAFYGPVRESKIIKVANTNFFASSTADFDVAEHDLTVTIQPGMLANGSPTSNASLTVPIDQIGPEDDYGYIITKT